MGFKTGDRVIVLSLGALFGQPARVTAIGGYGGVLTCELLGDAPPWRRGDVFHVPPYEVELASQTEVQHG